MDQDFVGSRAAGSGARVAHLPLDSGWSMSVFLERTTGEFLSRGYPRKMRWTERGPLGDLFTGRPAGGLRTAGALARNPDIDALTRMERPWWSAVSAGDGRAATWRSTRAPGRRSIPRTQRCMREAVPAYLPQPYHGALRRIWGINIVTRIAEHFGDGGELWGAGSPPGAQSSHLWRDLDVERNGHDSDG